MSVCVREQHEVDWMRTFPKYGILDPASEEPGYGQCLWNVEANKVFKDRPTNGAKTLVEVLEKSKTQHGTRRAAGWREVVKVHMIEDAGAKREKIELANEYKWITYQQYYDRVLSLAKGLSCLGVKAQSRVVIYAETQCDWLVGAFAAWHSNAQIVTIYATLGEEGAMHGINETSAETIIVDAKLVKIISKILPKCKTVKNVVTMTQCEPDICEQMQKAGAQMRSIDDVIALGRTSQYSPTHPKPEDVAVIMYTSGTTGSPKGVVLTHANIVACIAGVEHDLQGAITCEDVYLAYLPLAHIMEMGAEICFMSFGSALGFGSPHTLIDSGLKLKRPESMGDAPCLQPTFMVFAPAILDKVYQSVQSKKDGMGKLLQKIFQWGMNSGERHYQRGKVGANPLLNAVLFKKVQGLLGGRLKMMITGSAPLSPDIQKFTQTVFNAPVRQGYGLTETCAGSCVGFWGDNDTGSVGPPTVCAVIRLADWEEGNYSNADKDKPEIGMRRGEVLIGGPGVSSGYFVCPHHFWEHSGELEKKNKEDWITIQGVRYFRTGDIAQIKSNGTLQIIDRKKDLWKGPNGEYVALTKVEAALKLCEFVDMPMVYGRTGCSFPVAMICPQRARIMALGAELGKTDLSFEKLCGDEQVVAKVAAACNATCKKQKLVAFEIPSKVALIADPWTVENDMLTAALKLKRPLIATKHKEALDKMYA